MNEVEREIEVDVELAGSSVPAGRLWSHRRRGESATFAYLDSYLGSEGAYSLEPSLPLLSGQFQTPPGRGMFGAFSDSAPDGWGRRLISRQERDRARTEGTAERSFGEIDYLLGVRDDLRQGAIRLRSKSGYLADADDGVPGFHDLPALMNQAEEMERGAAGSTADLRDLFRAGSSLGGARPKAHVRRNDGRLAIAKFPSSSRDEWDVIRWEAVALELARRSGIGVPSFTLEEMAGRGVLVVDRFDRLDRRRVGYVSAMTMLEAKDRDQRSYVEIAEAIESDGADVVTGLRELWRRVAFTVLISNTDDHLRNHGFLRASTAGWTLAPAFDLNPDPGPGEKQLSTAIGFGDAEADLRILVEVADYFGVDDERARAVLTAVLAGTADWKRVAAGFGLDDDAVRLMAPAFDHDQRRWAEAHVTR